MVGRVQPRSDPYTGSLATQMVVAERHHSVMPGDACVRRRPTLLLLADVPAVTASADTSRLFEGRTDASATPRPLRFAIDRGRSFSLTLNSTSI